MGFNSYHFNEEGEKIGGFARVWSVEDKGKYSVVELSTSRKNADGQWETDFQNKFVRFVGPAHQMATAITDPVNIRIKSCDVTRYWSSEKQQEYINFVVFEFEYPENNNNKASAPAKKKPTNEPDFMNIPEGAEDEMPF